jgi:hypothetical protein
MGPATSCLRGARKSRESQIDSAARRATCLAILVIEMADRNDCWRTRTPDNEGLLIVHIGKNLGPKSFEFFQRPRVKVRHASWFAPQRDLSGSHLAISTAQTLPPITARNVCRPRGSPNLNAYPERWVRTIRQECLCRIIPIGEAHLRRARLARPRVRQKLYCAEGSLEEAAALAALSAGLGADLPLPW